MSRGSSSSESAWPMVLYGVLAWLFIGALYVAAFFAVASAVGSCAAEGVCVEVDGQERCMRLSGGEPHAD